MIYLIVSLWLSAGAFGVWLMVRDWLLTFGKLEVGPVLAATWALGVLSGPVAFTAGSIVFLSELKPKPFFTIKRKRPYEG